MALKEGVDDPLELGVVFLRRRLHRLAADLGVRDAPA